MNPINATVYGLAFGLILYFGSLKFFGRNNPVLHWFIIVVIAFSALVTSGKFSATPSGLAWECLFTGIFVSLLFFLCVKLYVTYMRKNELKNASSDEKTRPH